MFPEGPGASGVVRMSDEAVRTVKKRFRSTAQTVYGASEDLPDALGDLLSGCGQFEGEMAGGVTPFTASWQTTFELVEDEARTIAGNVNKLSIDLSRLDDGAS